MNELLAVCGLILLAIVLSLVLKKDAPVIAFLLTLTVGVLILLRIAGQCSGAVQRFSLLLSQAGMDSTLYLPVVKSVGVAAVVRVMGALCRDAGQSALAVKLELAGTAAVLTLCLPLLEQVFQLIANWNI